MHGCGSGTSLLANAEVDSMGGVVDGGVGIGVKTSPRRAAIEKAQAELRQENDIRDERRRELEFLEKGGNPLDFKFGNAASASVQSTSFTDQQAEHFATSEAKGSFAPTASPHGDSVESSGRPGVPAVCEPNSADNLLLFDGENELLDGDRSSIRPIKRKNIVPSEQSSRMDGTQNAKESEDSAIFRPYARRNRSKTKRDAARSSPNDIVQTRAGDGSSLSVWGSSRDAKGSKSDSNNQKEQNMLSVSNPKAATSNGDVGSKVISANHTNIDLDGSQTPTMTTSSKVSLPDDKLDVTPRKRSTDGKHNQSAQVDAQQTPVDVASRKPDLVGGNEQQIISAGVDCLPCEATKRAVNENRSNQQNGFGDQDRDSKSIPTEGQNSTAAVGTKFDSDSSCSQNSLSIHVNNDSDACINPKNVDSNGVPAVQTSDFEATVHLAGAEIVKEENEIKVDSGTAMNDDQNSAYQKHSNNSSMVKVEEEINMSKSDLQNEAKCASDIEGLPQNVQTMSGTDKTLSNMLSCDFKLNKENLFSGRSGGMVEISTCGPPESAVLGRSSAEAPDHQIESCNNLKLADKAPDDSILEEARIIKAKWKRIAELSVDTLPFETRRKCHWDFVLEEMAWLANDFAQERLWKMTAAAQLCHRAAFTSRLRSEEQNRHCKLKKVALNLAKAVMEFWHSAEVLLNNNDPTVGPESIRRDSVGSSNSVALEAWDDKETSKNLEQQCPRKNVALSIHGYAVRFLKHNSSPILPLQVEAPATPDRISDSGITEVSWDDYLTEESLFYLVTSGAMETYRKSIESHLAQCEKTARSMQEEVDTSMYDALAEFSYHDTAYDEEEGETSAYYLPGAFEGSKSLKLHKEKKNFIKYTGRSFEVEADNPYGHGTVGSQQSMMGKRLASNLNVGSIPIKRMRTASRQRIVGPFNAGAAGNVLAPIKTDASSGDTSSFQDDQTTLCGGSQIQKGQEVESAGDFEKQLHYDCVETSAKPKKKKKEKHLGSAFEQGWQLESTVYGEKRDHSKKRLEHHLDSNGNNGLYGQHNAKKPKIMKQSLDTSFDNITPMTGSVPSPAATQMSNMSNPNKFIKLIGGRDRGSKAKARKMSAGLPGSGSPWSLFEDQALVVLVHDMGPNWELVSDIMNCTLQFKCIFRKPQECKERHKILMDRGAGDGADSAEDSGSSQSYPSTLPGIPKGSARQLFQRLQGPMEEDTVRSHFEKIILVGKKYPYRKSQNESHDPRKVVPVHNSHVIALSQVCPNNLNGGILTPLDLCDASASSPDALSLGFQGSHSSGLGISNQGAMLHASGANSPLQGSSGIVLGSNVSSPSGPINQLVRDGRYNVPRANLPVDEQQRMQQHQMLSGRSTQQSNLPATGSLSGAERCVRMLPGGNGIGMLSGTNRSMPMPRPGFQGMASSPMLNSSSMISSSMLGMSPVTMSSGAGPGQGNSMLRPREALHMLRPGQNQDHQRQLMVPELPMQVTQGNGLGLPAFNGLSSALSNQNTPPTVQMFPGHPQQPRHMSPQQSHGPSNHHSHLQGPNHAAGSQQQAYALRLAKERQIHQQRYLQQQQQQQQQHQQFAASAALMPHVQPQSQLPISSTLQNNTQIQPQTSSQPVSMAPQTPSSMTPIALQHQQKHLTSPGLSRNFQSGASGLNNQAGKQRQRQPQQAFQQSGRNHPQQRHHAQPQQQAKLLKGIGRGNAMLNQNLNVDHLNGLNVAPINQAAEKGEQMMHLMQGQGSISGSNLSSVQPSKPLVPSQSTNHSQLQQKISSGPNPPSSKQLQQVPSHSDNSTQGQVPSVSSGHSPSATSHQAVLPSVMASNHQLLQLQPRSHHKQLNQTQTQPPSQRMLQNRLNSDLPNNSQTGQPQADKPGSNASPMGVSATTSLPKVCTESGSTSYVSSAVIPERKASDPVYDSGIPNVDNHVGSIGSPLINSSGNDAVTSVSQGLGQRQLLSGSLPPHGHNIGSPCQPQSQLQQSPTAPPASQKHCQPQDAQVLQQDQQQLFPQQQQMPHLLAAKGSLQIRPTNSKLE